MGRFTATRYDVLAADMRRQGKNELAAVFEKLADAEREHVDSVARWSRSCRPRQGSRSGHGALEGAGDLRRRRRDRGEGIALHDAVPRARDRGPQRGARLRVWSYLAAYSEDPEIKKASEAMAKEELGHVAKLRKERRSAYDPEHDREASQERSPPGRIEARRPELCGCNPPRGS